MDRSTEESETPFDGVLQGVNAPTPYQPHLVFTPKGSTPVRDYSQVIKSEYYQILENPKRLPFFIHPFFGKEREFTFFGKRNYFTPHFSLTDQMNVQRGFYLNFDVENLVIGAAGGMLIGAATKQYFQAHGVIARMTSQKWLKNIENGTATAVQRMAYGSVVASRVVKRAAFGAVFYDMLKRNAESKRNKHDWFNAAFAGGVSGAAFGLRGGFATGVASSIAFALCSTIHHFIDGLDSHSVTSTDEED